MENKKQLIDVKQAIAEINRVETNHPYDDKEDIIEKCVNILYAAPTVDAVEVSRIKEAKQNLLQIIDEFIAEYRHISESSVDHFGGKADAMETARRLVDNALTAICGKD